MSAWQNYMEEHREPYVEELTEFLRIPIYTPACMGGCAKPDSCLGSDIKFHAWFEWPDID